MRSIVVLGISVALYLGGGAMILLSLAVELARIPYQQECVALSALVLPILSHGLKALSAATWFDAIAFVAVTAWMIFPGTSVLARSAMTFLAAVLTTTALFRVNLSIGCPVSGEDVAEWIMNHFALALWSMAAVLRSAAPPKLGGTPALTMHAPK